MTPHLLIVYSSSLFARGLTHLLTGRADCVVTGTLPLAEFTLERMGEIPAEVLVLEGDEADPAIAEAMRVLHGCHDRLVLVRVNLSAPTLKVYRCDLPMTAGLDELADVLRTLADQPAAPPHSIEVVGGPV